MNSKQKGGIGVAAAIAHFAKRGDLVYSPITESGCDLVIERDGVLLRVEVKSTWSRGRACLKRNAGFYTAKGIKAGRFDGHAVDLLIVYNGETNNLTEFRALDLHGRASVTVG